MTWTMQVEIMQITFPWKSPSLSRSLSLFRVWGVSLHVCVAVFVFAMWRRVPGSDETAVKVQGEAAFSSFDTFPLTACNDVVAPVTLTLLPAVECDEGSYVCVCVHLHTDTHIHMLTDKGSMNKWGSSGSQSVFIFTVGFLSPLFAVH